MFFRSKDTPEKPDSPPAQANWGTFTPLEQYKLVRAQIEHENTVIGHRITWFLSFQGFMVAALFAAFSAMDKVQSGVLNKYALGIAVICICLLGIASAYGCRLLVSAALKQQDDVMLWWRKRVLSLPCEWENTLSTVDKPYPPMYDSGPGGKNSPKEMWIMFVAIGVFWLILGACYAWALSSIQPLKCQTPVYQVQVAYSIGPPPAVPQGE